MLAAIEVWGIASRYENEIISLRNSTIASSLRASDQMILWTVRWCEIWDFHAGEKPLYALK